MLIGTLALTGVGIPASIGFAGFYSKDAIIEARLRRRPQRRWRRSPSSADWSSPRPDRLLLLAADLHDLPRRSRDGHQPTHYDARGHDEPPTRWMLVPLVVLARRRDLRRRRRSTSCSSARARASSGAARSSRCQTNPHPASRAMQHVPAWVSLAAVRADGRSASWSLPTFYIRRPEPAGAQLAAQQPGLLRSSSTTSGTSTSSTTSSSCARRSALGDLLWKSGDGRSSTASGPTASSARVARRHQQRRAGSRPAISTTTPSSC